MFGIYFYYGRLGNSVFFSQCSFMLKIEKYIQNFRTASPFIFLYSDSMRGFARGISLSIETF